MTKRALRRLRHRDRMRAGLAGPAVEKVKSWRIIVVTEEGAEWWSQPIRSLTQPVVESSEGVKSYRIEEI